MLSLGEESLAELSGGQEVSCTHLEDSTVYNKYNKYKYNINIIIPGPSLSLWEPGIFCITPLKLLRTAKLQDRGLSPPSWCRLVTSIK